MQEGLIRLAGLALGTALYILLCSRRPVDRFDWLVRRIIVWVYALLVLALAADHIIADGNWTLVTDLTMALPVVCAAMFAWRGIYSAWYERRRQRQVRINRWRGR